MFEWDCDLCSLNEWFSSNRIPMFCAQDSGIARGQTLWIATKKLACVAWRFWLGALSNKGGRGQRNREEIGAEVFIFLAASPLVLARFAREFRGYAAPAPGSTKPPCYAGYPKACFVSPRSSKITVTKEKERRKRKSEDTERRRREKSNGCTLSFYNGYFGDCFWPKKHFWTEKVHLAVTFPKMTVDEPKFNIQNNRTSHAFTCYKWPPPIGDDSCIQNTKIFTVKAFQLEPLVNNHHL